MKCKNCGKDFKGNKRRKYCSDNCKKSWFNKRNMDKNRKISFCVLCGKDIRYTGQMKYCISCKEKAKKIFEENRRETVRIRAHEWYVTHREQKLKKLPCWICGKTVEYRRRRFCKSCSDEKEDIKRKMKEELRNVRHYIIKLAGGKCQLCGSQEKLHIHHTKRENKLEFLVVLCRKCHFKVEYSMEKHIPKYKRGNLIKEIRKKMKCEVCGSKKNILLHHIDKNRNNNKPENHALLCKKCHCKEHLKDENYGIRKGWFKKSVV